jgi:hypothetical protein
VHDAPHSFPAPFSTNLLARKLFPVAFRDNFDAAINPLDSRLIVNRVSRHAHFGSPFFRSG